jgi:hypothetical protein
MVYIDGGNNGLEKNSAVAFEKYLDIGEALNQR